MGERARFAVSAMFQGTLKTALCTAFSGQEKTEQSCAYRLDIPSATGGVVVKQYTNGTLYLEGKDTALFQQVLAVIRPHATEARVASKAKSPPSENTPRGKISLEGAYIGTDESGKGDYFGPLVIAGVYTTPETQARLEALGVQDSKTLSDARMQTMVQDIQALVGETGWHIVEIGPKRYNELYAQFARSGKKLNHLLAWGHARVIESLLAKNPDCTQAIADQFGSEHYIQSQLQSLGRGIRLFQTPKAEANVGVAAASILARVRFIDKLHKLGRDCGITLPPGAGPQVLAAGRALLARQGAEALHTVAKHHFKTTQQLLETWKS